MRPLIQALRVEARDHAGLLVFFAVYMLAANIVMMAVKGEFIGFPFNLQSASFYLVTRVTVYLGFIATVMALWGAVRDWLLPATPLYDSAFQAAWAPLQPTLSQPLRTALRIVAFICIFAILMSTFVQIKGIIPLVVPFYWDETFWAWDKALHGGIDPWRITWGLFDSDQAAHIIDRLYVSWFLIIHVVPVSVIAFDPDRTRRRQYLMSFFTLWAVLGNIAAIAFSSAGPCYTLNMAEFSNTLAVVYAPLMEGLAVAHANSPLDALQLQSLLWESYVDTDAMNIGISAMPSLHVAQAVLAACLAFRYHRVLGLIACAYAAVIQLGSVHLAWHYAIDGYVAAAATVMIWMLVGKILTNRNREIETA